MEHQSPQIVHSGSSITTFRVPMNAYTSQQLIMLNQNSIEEQKRMSLSKPRLKTPLLNLNQSKSLGIVKLEASGPSENNGLDQIYEDGRDGTYRMQQADQANQIN